MSKHPKRTPFEDSMIGFEPHRSDTSRFEQSVEFEGASPGHSLW